MTLSHARARLRHGLGVLGRASGVVSARARNWARPPLTVASQPTACNAMFSRRRALDLAPERQSLESEDLYLFDAMRSPRLHGQIVFEYGTLLRASRSWAGLAVLDIGTGRSTFPRWMVRRGASAVTLELSQPVEVPAPGFHARVDRLIRLDDAQPLGVFGSMRTLPFADSRFDVVTSISVLEHLDTDLPRRTYVPYDQQTGRLGEAIDEMVRVAKPGGLVYITSECCDYGRATVDHWRGAYYYDEGPPLSAAWPVADVRALFYDRLVARGCELVGGLQFDAADIADPDRWTFRGPYFSGFCVLARKGRRAH